MKKAGHRTRGEIAKQEDQRLMRSVFRLAQEQPRSGSFQSSFCAQFRVFTRMIKSRQFKKSSNPEEFLRQTTSSQPAEQTSNQSFDVSLMDQIRDFIAGFVVAGITSDVEPELQFWK